MPLHPSSITPKSEDTHATVSMEDVLAIDGSLFASNNGEEPIISAANVNTGVEQTPLEVHDEDEVNTERLSLKYE